MSPRAFILGLIAIATFFAAVNVQAGWLYALADAFLGLLGGCLAIACWSVRSLGLLGLADAQVEQGTPLRVAVTLENRGLAPRGFLAALAPPIGRTRPQVGAFFGIVPRGWPARVVARLAPGEWSQATLAVPTPRRGVFRSPRVFVQSAPMGLFAWRRRVPISAEVVVTPRIHPIESLPWFRPDARGGEEHPMARTVPHGEMIRSTRDYRGGDPLRTIHWRGTARIGRLVVKETEGMAIAGGATVLLDLAGHQDEGLDHAVEVAASLLAYFHGQGIAARLITQDGEFAGSLASQLEALARAEASAASLAPQLADLDPGGLVVVASRNRGWHTLAPCWIQVGPPDMAPAPGAIACPRGADVAAVLLAGRPG